MGQCCGKRVEVRIPQSISCPRCGVQFPQGTVTNRQFNTHLDHCLRVQEVEQPPPIEVWIADEQHLSFWERVGEGENERWEKRQIDFRNLEAIRGKAIQEIRSSTFAEKQVWFRSKLELMRVPWQDGCTFVKVSAQDLLKSSFAAVSVLTQTQFHGELKIVFTEESNVQDAGGVLREWINLVSSKLVDTQSLLKVNADQYHLSSNERKEDFTLFGLLAGKAFFEKIPVPLLLTRTLVKQLLGLPIQLEDFKHQDQSMYSSFKYMLENEIDPLEIMLDFTVENQGKTIVLKENGSNIFVNNQNKNEYMDLYIQYFTLLAIETNLNSFLQGFYKIIPPTLIRVFTPEELEMILFGLPFINLDDWKLNTQYKGKYNNQHSVITWFWKVLEGFSQLQLSKFLRFCTGSSRTPVHGFKKLEGNRGEVHIFCIESSEFSRANPYPKAHTCFNRLDLPIYRTYEEVEMYVTATLSNVLEGQFGLE